VAVERGLLGPLASLGYRPAGSKDGHRGAWVAIANGAVLITVTVDWLEGDLHVCLRSGPGEDAPLASLVDVAKAHGLRLSRLPRGVSAGVLESQLGKVAELLLADAQEVLVGSDEGLARLAAAAADP
jgi:hypothetical protein